MVATAPDRLDTGLSMHELWSIIVRRRALILAGAVIGLAAALVLSLLMVPQYRTSATLEIDDQPVQMVDLGGRNTIPVADSQFLETQLALLRSRSLAERVARDLKLAANPEFANQSASPAARLDQATTILNADVLVEPVSESRLVRVGYVSSDPGLAAEVSNSFAENFIQSNLQRRYDANEYARDFLQRRIGEVRARLEDSERKLVQYAQAQTIVSVGAQGGEGSEGLAGGSLQAASLGAANSELALAQNARVAAQQRYLQATRSAATTEVLQSPSLQSMKTRLAELRSNYAQKRTELKPDHPEIIELQSGIDALERDIGSERGTIVAALQAEYRAAAAREQELQGRVRNLTSNVLDLRGRTIQYNILQRDVDTNRQLYDALLQRFKEVGVSGGVGENLVSIVDLAKRPDAPFEPDIPRNVLVGLLLGLAAGTGLAIASGLLMNKVKLPADLESQLGIPSLGVVPVERELPIDEALVTPRSSLFEAYASLRSQIQFATAHTGLRSLLVTSSAPGEGKTTTSLALAQNFARMGKSTILIDADLRHPSLQAETATPGLVGVLAGESSIENAVVVTDTANLSLLPTGIRPVNPADLLSAGQLKSTIDQLCGKYDIAIIDGPPVLGLADAPLLAAAADRVLVVLRADGVRVPSARNALQRLRAANAKILGGVLTMFNGMGALDSYGYEYSYGNIRSAKAMIRVGTRAKTFDDTDQTTAASEPLTHSREGQARRPSTPFASSGAMKAIQLVFWACAVAVLYLATSSGGQFSGWSDSAQHTIAFVILTAVAVLAFPKARLWVLGLALAAFGAVIELVQTIPALGRQGEVSEFVIDLIAICCVLMVVWAIRSVLASRREG